MRILNTALGILGSRFLRRPFYGRVHVTYRCNYRCRMCGIEGIRTRFDELETEAFLEVAARLRAVGARHVVITGGEPFLRRDLADIVGHFARRRFSVRIQTNGGPQVTRESLMAVARAGVTDLSVSVDTLDETTQDWITGARGSLSHALRTLDWARDIMPSGMSLANIVASPHNFARLPELVRYFADRSMYSYITPAAVAVSHPEAHLFRGSDGSFEFGAIDAKLRDAVIDELIALRRGGMGLTNSTRHLRDFRQYIASGRVEWDCHSGMFALDVRPDGSVSACKEHPPIASILSPDFVRVFRSDEFRSRANEQARSCAGCFYGEYREPLYAIRDASVLQEWTRDWMRTFRRGMRWGGANGARNVIDARDQSDAVCSPRGPAR
jgi:MoaA/NifB/PqqE/SkfB family radical SAM enzyme